MCGCLQSINLVARGNQEQSGQVFKRVSFKVYQGPATFPVKLMV
jgi:hypothetical protein